MVHRSFLSALFSFNCSKKLWLAPFTIWCVVYSMDILKQLIQIFQVHLLFHVRLVFNGLEYAQLSVSWAHRTFLWLITVWKLKPSFSFSNRLPPFESGLRSRPTYLEGLNNPRWARVPPSSTVTSSSIAAQSSLPSDHSESLLNLAGFFAGNFSLLEVFILSSLLILTIHTTCQKFDAWPIY